MSKSIETIIIGGGQAGLSVSYCLSQQSIEHVILDQASQAANTWRNGRWDSFTLVTPNWSIRLPGAWYSGPDPDGYLSREEIISFLEDYLNAHYLPIRYDTRVYTVEPVEHGYRVTSSQGDWMAKNVVVAAGLFQFPRIPEFARKMPGSIQQLHSGQYRRPEALPDGPVLVVGTAQSGCQIAEELYQAGKTVYLSVSSVGRVPRRYRGKDVYEWLVLSGFIDRKPEQLPSPQARFAGNPHVTGKNGGHTLNLHQFHRDGVRLLGRALDASEGHLHLAQDLHANLEKADQLEVDICKGVDEFIARSGLDAPQETLPKLRDAYSVNPPDTLDLEGLGIGTVIWATGYGFNFRWVQLPVLDDYGFPVQARGVTRFPGLYFAGLPWMDGQKSGLFLGVGEQAEWVAEQIYARR